MTLHYELTFNDYLEFNYYYLWSRPERKFYRVANSAMPLFVMIVLGYFFKGLNFQLYDFGDLTFLFVGILLFFLMPYLVKRNYRHSVSQLLASGTNQTLLGAKTIIFEEDHIVEQTKYSNSTLSWEGFEYLKESSEYFFLFQNANQAIIIPKRIFTDDAEKEGLSLFIKSHLSNKKCG